MPIAPLTAVVRNTATKQFTVTGIISAKWGIRSGKGSISSSGIYTPAGLGSATIRAMSEMWQTVDSNLYDNENNTVSVNTSGGYWEARSQARLTTAGDEFIFIFQTYFMPYLFDTGNNFASLYLGDLYYSGSLQFTPSPALVPGDNVSFVRIGSNQVGFKINGTLVHTLSATTTNPLQPAAVAMNTAPVGTICKAPTFAGSGITGYTEYTADISVFLDVTPFTSGDPLLQAVPRSGLEIWYAGNKSTENEGDLILADLSGNARHATATGDVPVVQEDLSNGVAGIYFDGTNDPFLFDKGASCHHMFLVCSYEDAAFATGINPGIISGLHTHGLLAGVGDSDKFYDFSGDNGPYFYIISDLGRSLSDALAPMSGSFAVIELIFDANLALSGLVVGRDRDNSARLWKGWFLEALIYSEVKSTYDRQEIYRYFAMKYWLWSKDVADRSIFPFPVNKTENTDRILETFLSEPYTGEKKALIRGTNRKQMQLPFLIRHQAEMLAAEQFHKEHFPLMPFIYRDYRFNPLRDLVCRMTSSFKEQGSDTTFRFNYSFEVEEL